MNFNNIKKIITEAKLVISTIAFIIAALIGSYNIVTKYFVTKLYAKELISDVTNQLTELKKQTKQNHRLIIEMRMIRIENKIANGGKLTPTEARVYKNLLKNYKEY